MKKVGNFWHPTAPKTQKEWANVGEVISHNICPLCYPIAMGEPVPEDLIPTNQLATVAIEEAQSQQ